MTNRSANLDPYLTGAASILDLSGFSRRFAELLRERATARRPGRGLASDFVRVGGDLEQALVQAVKNLDPEQQAALTRILTKHLGRNEAATGWRDPALPSPDQLELGLPAPAEATSPHAAKTP